MIDPAIDIADGNPTPTIILDAHIKKLMDPVLLDSESGDVKEDPLTTDQEKLPNVRS